MTDDSEVERVVQRYGRRTRKINARYSMLDAAVWQSVQERQRILIRILNTHLNRQISEATLLEIGCGSGTNLLELLRLGFLPENLVGNELISARIEAARHQLPVTLRLIAGDATTLPFPDASFDVVYQSAVFTSLLDDRFQETLAAQMWRWVKPGGGVLWYDFTYDNPSNPDVRGVRLSRVRELFPNARLSAARVTLAPPISRWVTSIHP